jgi:replicative DNA helicase
LLDSSEFDNVQQILNEKMFYDVRNAKIFAAMQELNRKNKLINELNVKEILRKNKEDFDGHYFEKIIGNHLYSSDLTELCQIVLQKFINREIIRTSHQNQIRAFADMDDPYDILFDANKNIEQIMELVADVTKTNDMCFVMQETLKTMYLRVESNKNNSSVGITTGFADLDFLTNGWQKEKLVILAARPAVGKTSIAVHFAKRAAQKGTNVLFFSLEMGATELMEKIITAHTGISPENYAAGRLKQSEIDRVECSVDKLLDLLLIIEDKPNVTVEQIISKARLWKKKGKCDLVIVDYLQLITPSSRTNRNREQEVTEMSRKLKVAAKSLKVPFIVLCQLNRDIEKRGKNAEPQLSDLRESGAIEQDADIVMFIHRPEMNSDTAEKNSLELIVRKHRGGKIGKVRVQHNGNMNEFYDYDYTKEQADLPF